NVTRLNSFFGRINYADNSNHSSFNGGTFLVRKRFDAGYSFQVAFTRGKTIDLLGGAPGCNKCSENANVFDAYNINFQRGLSDQDVSKQLSFNFNWDIQAEDRQCVCGQNPWGMGTQQFSLVPKWYAAIGLYSGRSGNG